MKTEKHHTGERENELHVLQAAREDTDWKMEERQQRLEVQMADAEKSGRRGPEVHEWAYSWRSCVLLKHKER